MSAEEPVTVGILLFDGVEVLDFAGPFEVFSAVWSDADEHGEIHPLFRVITLAETADLVTSFGGLLVKPQATIREHPPLDILVVPGGHITDVVARQEVLDWIVQQDRQTTLTTSVCTGAFVLAKCGLLDQHRATTHWSGIESLRERYPAIEVVTDARFVDEGHLITSAGISAGIDMSLHVVARLFGEPMAADAARGMEYDWSTRGNV